MKLPIVIVADDRTIDFYKNIDDLQVGLESYDVDSNVYTAYDAEGVLYDLVVENKADEPKGIFLINTCYGNINMKPSSKLANLEELKQILIDNLTWSAISIEDIDDINISLLINKLFIHQGYALDN